MDDLELVIGKSALLPQGIEVEPMGPREFKLRAPGMKDWVRVSTNPVYYEQNADAMELWSPGNPAFPELTSMPDAPTVNRLSVLLATLDRPSSVQERRQGRRSRRVSGRRTRDSRPRISP